jgi:hypothetical protein
MARPDALGVSFQIKSLDDADLALAELSWLENQNALLTAKTKQKVDAIKTEIASQAVVEIEGTFVVISDRIEILAQALEKFVSKQIEKHLPDGKRSIDLAHGTLGLRKTPATVVIPEGVKEAVIVEAIDEATFGLVGKLRGFLTRLVKQWNGSLRDLITVKITPNLSSIKTSLAEKRITAAQVESLGLVIVPESDVPVVKLAECKTASE